MSLYLVHIRQQIIAKVHRCSHPHKLLSEGNLTIRFFQHQNPVAPKGEVQKKDYFLQFPYSPTSPSLCGKRFSHFESSVFRLQLSYAGSDRWSVFASVDFKSIRPLCKSYVL
ncbi:hypothetical protein TNCT_374431 [Trichonephila clavata]|uniref:Uncharacterized protein n=1 Tax=Trichonephila clavata TaxID=2740835 RepID=A0A8X6L372_TRICU|nr:hypothetical protein TNCT_374431 [Trichonephila clavata]